MKKAAISAASIGLATQSSIVWSAAKEALDKHQLIETIHQQTQIPLKRIHTYLNNATFDKSIIRKINTPYEARPYADYRPLFVHDRLAKKGKAYLQEHQKEFQACYEKYGIQPEIIAAILGMETRYGAYKGKDRVLDALFTLATGFPRRSSFFAGELGEFLLLCEEEKLNPEKVQGSYAGAFGTTQFIPSSYRAFSIDADQDGKRDVWNSPADIIHSVGNYFRKHHWQDHKPVAQWIPELPKHAFTDKMLKDETRKAGWHKLSELRQHNIPHLPESWSDQDKVALIQRKTITGTRTALVHRNFYVITRWNRSYNYALAISELAYLLGCSHCNIETP